MKRQKYYPALLAERPEWHLNLAAKLPGYAATLPLTTAQANNGVADNLYMAYGLGVWITNVREHGPACTAALETLATGTGGEPFVFPAYTTPPLPALPVGITEVLPGALDRIFRLVQTIKNAPGYTPEIGQDLGIIGPEAPPAPPPGEGPPPRITVTVIAGDEHENVRLKFIKDGHEGVDIQSRRGGGAWEDIGSPSISPFVDDRALLNPAQAEVREYRVRFTDNDQPTSEWCAVEKVTVSP